MDFKAILLNLTGGFVKLVLALLIFGWVSYEKAESFVNKKIDEKIEIAVSLKDKDIKYLSDKIDTVSRQNEAILTELLRRKR